MKNKEVLLDKRNLKKADLKILKAFGEYIMLSLKNKGKEYNVAVYGEMPTKKWNKNDYIKWLEKFDIKVKKDEKKDKK